MSKASSTTYIMPPLIPTEEQVLDTFRIFDVDGSGLMEVEELTFAFQALGLGEIPKVAIDAMVKQFCPAGAVQVTADEFLRIVQTKSTHRNSQEESSANYYLLMHDGNSGDRHSSALCVEDLMSAARRTGEIPAGDIAAEARWRRVFESAAQRVGAPSSGPGGEAEIDVASWNAMMRESISDKRHRQPLAAPSSSSFIGGSVADQRSFDIKTRQAAVVAKRGPYGHRVEAGQSYLICSCGMSKNQPFCDGSHDAYNRAKGTSFAPIAYRAEETKTVWFCGCKQSQQMPFCDGSHTTLPL